MNEENENNGDGESRSLLGAIDEIAATQVDESDMAGFGSEDEFMDLGVSLLIEVGSYTCVAANVMDGTGKWSRDQAVIGGNLVRLYKQISALLDQTVQRRRETSFVFARLAFETIVNVRFLIKHYSPDVLGSYVQHSFKHEAKLLKDIQDNIAARNGEILPIEDRMMKSIQRSFDKAGITPDDMRGYTQRNWGGKNLYEKATDLGLEEAYLGAFAGPSHSVHGAWGDIYAHNLIADEYGQFTPNLDWCNPRPQLIAAVAKLSICAVDDFLCFILDDENYERIFQKLSELHSRLRQFDEAHERYLGAKTWPGI